MSEHPVDDNKRRQCHECGAWMDRLAMQCAQCKADLPALGHSRRSSRGRRYVYGQRKPHLSQEAIWLLVVIIVGLLIVFGVQVLAYMRSKKLVVIPQPRPQMLCRLHQVSREGPPAPTSSLLRAASAKLTPLPPHLRIRIGNTIGATHS